MACFSCGVSPDSGATSEDLKELIAGSNTQTSHQCPAPWSRRRVPLLCHPQWCLRLWPFLQSANLICQAREKPRGADAPLMGQSHRHEAGLFDRATATAVEDRDALSTAGLAATGIDMHQQLADFAAGGSGGLACSDPTGRDGRGSGVLALADPCCCRLPPPVMRPAAGWCLERTGCAASPLAPRVGELSRFLPPLSLHRADDQQESEAPREPRRLKAEPLNRAPVPQAPDQPAPLAERTATQRAPEPPTPPGVDSADCRTPDHPAPARNTAAELTCGKGGPWMGTA